MVLSSVLDFRRHPDYWFDIPYSLSISHTRVLEYPEGESGWCIHRSSDLFGITGFSILHSADSTLNATYQPQSE